MKKSQFKDRYKDLLSLTEMIEKNPEKMPNVIKLLENVKI